MKQIDLSGIFNILSRILLIEVAGFISCIPVALYYDEPTIPFLISSLIAGLFSLLLYAISNRWDTSRVGVKDAFVSVSLSWLTISLFGSLPYILSGVIPSLIDSVFESTSGFTTTGSSILTDIEVLPRSILFWRSMTHWIGGLGIVLLVVIILPSLNTGGYRIFIRESSAQEKTHPRIRTMGVRMLLIYLLLTGLQVIFMMAGGVDLFESICHSFATIATGGFSTRNNSIGAFSPYEQYVVMIFMVLAGTNFIVHYFMLRGMTRKALKDEELRFYWIVIIVSGLVVSGMLFLKMHLSPEKAFRDGFFQVISIITSTGFATADYLLWPGFVTTIMFGLLFVGGSTGSTSGGIKMARHLLVLKNIKSTLQKTFSPNLVSVIKLNGQEIPVNRNITVLTFVLLYLFIFLISTIVMTLMGIDPETSAGSVATVMGGIGPGLGSVGPAANFAHLPELAKILLSFLMIVGRLEIFTILAIFMPQFWKE